MSRFNLAYEAMMFARQVHANQKRKYTGNPYADHLAEVAGIAMTAWGQWPSCTEPGGVDLDQFLAVCWLHDCREDQGVTFEELVTRFNSTVAYGVTALSDLEEGNRAARKAAARVRLAEAHAWVQTIKLADLISNTGSIVQHDPKFAAVYFEERRLLLDVMTKGDRRLHALASALACPADALTA